ncbi:MAG TPA: hypothetical protein PLI11_05600 [Clostridia bacterium]|jgi:hypothetical protein|nr:hypothetical protein [Clostridiaceae bacterium]HPZ52371.1 hypothetical protein [Clostridia bacterium]
MVDNSKKRTLFRRVVFLKDNTAYYRFLSKHDPYGFDLTNPEDIYI